MQSVFEGPYLKLSAEHQPASWLAYEIYEINQTRKIRFFEKGLQDNAYCETTLQHPVYVIHLITQYDSITQYVCAFFVHEESIYQATSSKHNIEIKNLITEQRIQNNKTKKTLLENNNIQFSNISPPTISEKDQSYSTLNVYQKEITTRYSLDSLIQGMHLSEREQSTLPALKKDWPFEPMMSADDIHENCVVILGGEQKNSEKTNEAYQFRHEFLLKKDYEEIKPFILRLIQEVHRRSGNEKPLPTQTPLSNPVNHQDAPFDENFIIDEDDQDVDLTLALFNSLEDLSAQPKELTLVSFRQDLKNKIFPPSESPNMNIFMKLWESFLNLCAILDIYCLKMSKTSQQYQNDCQKDDNDLDKTIIFSLFNTSDSYEQSLKKEYVKILWQGRT